MQQQSSNNLPTIKELVKAGAHLGHVKQKWNPRMQPYVYGYRNGLYVIDLAKTRYKLKEALGVVGKVVQQKKAILFVGTAKSTKDIIREEAVACEEYYVCERWLGGTLTNFKTIQRSIKTLDQVEEKLENHRDELTKKELVLLEKERVKLDSNFSGIREMKSLPGLLIVVNPLLERIAVAEGNKLGIPVMALTDTNCDPTPIQHVIACNDDARNSVQLIVSCLSQEIKRQKEQMVVEEKEGKSDDVPSSQGDKEKEKE